MARPVVIAALFLAASFAGAPVEPPQGGGAASLQQQESRRGGRQPHCAKCDAWYVPQMAIAPDGGFYTLWVDRGVGSNDETLYLRRLKPDGTDAWKKYVPVGTARRREGVPFAIRDPDIVPDGFGGVIVAWSGYDQNDFNLYAQRVDDLGAFYWTRPSRVLCAAPGDQVHVKLMVDKIGGAFAAWQDRRSGNWDVYFHHVKPGGDFLAIPEGGLQVTSQNRNEYLTTLAADGLGGVWITWWDERSGRSDLLSSHVDGIRHTVTTRTPYLWRQYD